MASDLISREALVEDCLNWLNRFNTDAFEFATCFPYWIFHNAIKEAPAVDAVEVVRCKDCQERTQSCGMVLHCRLNGIQTDDDDFCSYGRKLVEKDATD